MKNLPGEQSTPVQMRMANLRRTCRVSARSIIAAGLFDMASLRRNAVVHRDPNILGGTPVFVGTRVPVRILFEYLQAGDSLERFLGQFPTVRREQAVAALEMAREILTEDANPA
jgi:uncharacterized protein (DUF433 family)